MTAFVVLREVRNVIIWKEWMRRWSILVQSPFSFLGSARNSSKESFKEVEGKEKKLIYPGNAGGVTVVCVRLYLQHVHVGIGDSHFKLYMYKLSTAYLQEGRLLIVMLVCPPFCELLWNLYVELLWNPWDCT